MFLLQNTWSLVCWSRSDFFYAVLCSRSTWFVLCTDCIFLGQTFTFLILESNQIWNKIKLKTKQNKTKNSVPYEKKWVICSLRQISQISFIRILCFNFLFSHPEVFREAKSYFSILDLFFICLKTEPKTGRTKKH